LQSSLASAGKIFSILDEKPDIVKPTHPVEVNIKGRIEFRHVWFAYEKDDYILKEYLSLNAKILKSKINDF
jgi:ATP-binding cassette subfamily B protein